MASSPVMGMGVLILIVIGSVIKPADAYHRGSVIGSKLAGDDTKSNHTRNQAKVTLKAKDKHNLHKYPF